MSVGTGVSGTATINGAFIGDAVGVDFVNSDAHKIVKIEILDVGFHVVVGCKSLAFTSKKDLLKALEMYIDDPKKAREKYLKNG